MRLGKMIVFGSKLVTETDGLDLMEIVTSSVYNPAVKPEYIHGGRAGCPTFKIRSRNST